MVIFLACIKTGPFSDACRTP